MITLRGDILINSEWKEWQNNIRSIDDVLAHLEVQKQSLPLHSRKVFKYNSGPDEG
jgi:hypothetical protein